MKRVFICSVIFLSYFFVSCGSPKIKKELKEISARQDSILTILNTIKEPTLFIAKKVGWEPPDDTLPKNIPIGDSYTQGAKEPVLTIVEFSDFQCPYCARVAPILDSLIKIYPNKIQVVFKHFPLNFHKQAPAAHAAALAAGKQGKFYLYRYKLAPKYKALNDSTYLAVAEEIGLDIEQFKQDMKLNPEVQGKINKDMQLGQSLGVRGTPTLFANGRKVKDRSFNGFVRLLKQYGG